MAIIKEDVFKKIGKSKFLELLNEYKKHIEIDAPEFLRIAESHIKNSTGKEFSQSDFSKFKSLQDRWYSEFDYSAYDDPLYICDLWACWSIYSRKSILSLVSKKSLNGSSVVDLIGNCSSVLDLGCGFGYTSAALKQVFPKAEIFATNIEGTVQYKVAEEISRVYNFSLTSEIPKKEFNLIFASEYFEHIKNPIEHLCDLIDKTHPRFMVIANGFNGIAIGHFTEYLHHGKPISASKMSLVFNESMNQLGYKKIKTKIWNNRPAVWIRK